MQQVINHSNVTIFINCVYASTVTSMSNFNFLALFKAEIEVMVNIKKTSLTTPEIRVRLKKLNFDFMKK